MVRKVYKHFMGDSLYRNSIYLMLSTGVMAFFGFFFWILNARLFNPAQIGLATTIISVASLIASFSLLGLNAGLIRYLPASKRKNDKINTSLMLIAGTAIVLGIGYLANIRMFSPTLAYIQTSTLLSCIFIVLLVFIAVNTFIENVFIAYRSSKYVLMKNVVLNIIRISLPILLISFGAFGIFMSYGISVLVGVVLCIGILTTKFKFVFRPLIRFAVVQQMIKFSFGNYVAGFLYQLPMNILPIIITNRINPSSSAFFYMGLMIANVLYIIPIASSQSLFAEGSYSQKELKSHVKKACLIIFATIIPAILLTMLFGKYVLLAFGKQYSSEGFVFLQLLAASGIFVSLNYIGNALANIKHKVTINIVLNFINAVSIIGLSLVLLPYQLTGIGIAWLLGNAITAVVYLVLITRLI